MPWLRHFALFVVFVSALPRSSGAGALVSVPNARSQARVGPFQLVAVMLVVPARGATWGLHEGIGAAYDENASGCRFAAGGGRAAMSRSAASPDGSQGTLEILVHEASGQIRHVLFRSGVAP